MGFKEGSLGGGMGAEGATVGGGIAVPNVSEPVDGGRGGNWIEEDDNRRPLWMEEEPNDERRSVAMAQKVS